MKRGVFTISIDYEFAWGYADHVLTHQDISRIADEVVVVRRLLALFEKYTIPALWAIVGHLLKRTCLFENGLAHPEYVRPLFIGEERDWFAGHPKDGEANDMLWYDTRNLIPRIAESSAGHEIGSHGFAHVMYGNSQIAGGTVQVDIDNLIRVHKNEGYSYNSFIFPRNREGFHESLADAGVKVYRGNTRRWYDIFSGPLKRFMRLCDYFLPWAPTVLPQTHSSGLVNIPDSLLLLGRNGLRKCIPPWLMVWKIKRGIRNAVNRKEIFHLWFHPSNFSYDTDTQFKIFEKVLHYADALREKGLLDISTMGHITKK